MSKITQTKRKRGLFFKETGVFAHEYVLALKKMTEVVVCPCHGLGMTIVVSDGQAINLNKECRRQCQKGDREVGLISRLKSKTD